MFSRRTRHLTEVEVIQLKRLFSATKSRLVRTQANRPLHLSQWYEQMWKARFTVHVPPRERALAEVQWPESLRPFHLKTCGRVRDSPALMLFKPSTFLSIVIETMIYVYFVIRWFEFIAFFHYFCVQQRLKGCGLSITCNLHAKKVSSASTEEILSSVTS